MKASLLSRDLEDAAGAGGTAFLSELWVASGEEELDCSLPLEAGAPALGDGAFPAVAIAAAVLAAWPVRRLLLLEGVGDWLFESKASVSLVALYLLTAHEFVEAWQQDRSGFLIDAYGRI